MRRSHPLRLVLILAPLIALALGSFWLFEVVRRASEDAFPAPQRKEPDFYVENFDFVKVVKASGKVQYHIAGEKLVHHPVDDSYSVVAPVVSKLDEGQPPLKVRSERAVINSDYSEVHMYDNVHINRPKSPQNEAMQLITDYLLVLPDEDAMKTPNPVEITYGASKLTGTGMYTNNATREFHLMNNVHGTYQAPKP